MLIKCSLPPPPHPPPPPPPPPLRQITAHAEEEEEAFDTKRSLKGVLSDRATVSSEFEAAPPEMLM